MDFKAIIRVNYESAEHAEIARTTLSVDKEIQPKKVQRTVSCSGAVLVISFQATELKLLRVAISSMFDLTKVVSQTLAEFA